MKNKNRAFTLIELLIVVAIIAILAAIAVPNFLEAQTRSKVARCKADMRSVATAIEAYAVDYNRAPFGLTESQKPPLKDQLQWDNTAEYHVLRPYVLLTTPVSYITSIPQDPFALKARVYQATKGVFKLPYWEYKYNFALPPCSKTNNANYNAALAGGYIWTMTSPGPSRTYGTPYEWQMIGYLCGNPAGGLPTNVYDSTNGTTSLGYIFRTNKGDFGEGGLK